MRRPPVRAGSPLLAWSVLALALFAGCDEEAGADGLECGPDEGRVARVIDGDTFRFVAACGSAADCPDGGECADGTCTAEETIRLLGINAGEIPKQGSSDHHCLGDAAKSRLEALIGGQNVRLEFDPVAGCTGLYDRRLAYVFAGDRLAQTGLLTDGLACTFWFTNEDDKESMRYYTAMADAEDAARSVGVGIYSPTTSICGGLPIHPDCD